MSRRLSMDCRSFSFSASKTMSSAYIKIQILSSSCNFIPLPSALRDKAKSFINKLKRIGDSEQPCLSPFLTVEPVCCVAVDSYTTAVYKDFKARNIFPLTPVSLRRFHSRFLSTRANAFLKSIKGQNVDERFFCRVSIKFGSDKTWSIVFLSLRNPFCSSTSFSFSSTHFVNLLLRIAQ